MEKIVNNALRALLYEVVTLPKPGLVDPLDQGSHQDMNIYTFIDSSLALTSYFEKANELGKSFNGEDLTQMFKQLRQMGLVAEQEMLSATKGINTHKGAIFSLGIFVCAQSYAQVHDEDPFLVIKKMCQHLVAHDFKNLPHENLTAGQKQYLKYKIGGARQVAEEGYPIVKHVALPFLRKSAGTKNQRLLDTLMKIASQADDTTFIKRAHGKQNLTWLHEMSRQFLALGGSRTQAGMAFLKKENAVFKKQNYTIGGCADLLIVTVFMGLEENIL